MRPEWLVSVVQVLVIKVDVRVLTFVTMTPQCGGGFKIKYQFHSQ